MLLPVVGGSENLNQIPEVPDVVLETVLVPSPKNQITIGCRNRRKVISLSVPPSVTVANAT
jgi:hypothetical protein